MALKILTGQIVPGSRNRNRGTATINFDRHEVTGDATGGSINTIGGGRYIDKPGILVALRDFIAQDRRKASEDFLAQDRFRIDTGVLNRDRLEVEWECESGAQIVEISYLVVGEV
jgi:hypothetical protein